MAALPNDGMMSWSSVVIDNVAGPQEGMLPGPENRPADIDTAWYVSWTAGISQDEDIVQQLGEEGLQQYRSRYMLENLQCSGIDEGSVEGQLLEG